MRKEAISQKFWRRVLLFSAVSGVLLGVWIGYISGWKSGVAVALAFPCAAGFVEYLLVWGLGDGNPQACDERPSSTATRTDENRFDQPCRNEGLALCEGRLTVEFFGRILET